MLQICNFAILQYEKTGKKFGWTFTKPTNSKRCVLFKSDHSQSFLRNIRIDDKKEKTFVIRKQYLTSLVRKK